jgi:glycosyltransferase involved in cell wall biosynthesis
MQKTNFPFQAYVSDDCSTDGTDKIIGEYAEKYPEIIVPIKRDKNLGVMENFIDTADRIKSEYVALCEGDDYWTDENKLQKQVDYLDAHRECAICFHQTQNFFDDGSAKSRKFPSPDRRFNREITDLQDLLKHNYIQTNSVVYRWRFAKENIRDVFPANIIPGDYFMHLLHAQKGAIGFMEGTMAAYRRHAGGIWYDAHHNLEKSHLKHGIQELNFHFAVENQIAIDRERQHEKTCSTAAQFINIYIKNKKYALAAEIAKLCPDALAATQRKKIKISLFGIIPLIKIQYIRADKAWIKLFGFIPLLKIRR